MSQISLTRSKVPDYLVGSDFYSSLSPEDGEEFTVPSTNLKMTTVIKSTEDLHHLLHTIRFWGLHDIPAQLIDFLLVKVPSESGEFNRTCHVLLEFEETFQLHQLYQDFQKATSPKMQLDAALACGRKDVLEYLIGHGKQANALMVKSAAENGLLDLLTRTTEQLRAKNKNPFTQMSLRKVASGGHTECLRFVLTNGCKMEPNVCLAAAEHGHLDCLVVAREFGCEWNDKVTSAAALRGHLTCLQYALQHGCPLGSDAAYNACLNGHLECLLLLLENGSPLLKRLCNGAAAGGHLECLQTLLEMDCPWDSICVKMACQHGHLDCLLYLVEERGYQFPWFFSLSYSDAAAQGGHADCLEYLVEDCGARAAGCTVYAAALHGHISCLRVLGRNGRQIPTDGFDGAFRTPHGERYVRSLILAGYEMPANLATIAVLCGNNACLRYVCTLEETELTDEDAEQAARDGNLEALQILHEHDCPWDEATTDAAAREGQLGCLQFAVENGCELSDEACTLAATGGHLSVLEYAHAAGAELTTETCAVAIEQHHMPCLRFAVDHGAPLEESLCESAAGMGGFTPSAAPLKFLRYLHEAHCPWDERTCATAALYGKLDVLKYAHENGCPWDGSTSWGAAAHSSTACLEYLHEQGYPWDVSATHAAAKWDNMQCLRYLLEHGCPRDETSCAAAAECHYPEGLKILHEAGCPWDVRTTLAAAQKTNLEGLKYAHEHGCPWDASVSRAAGMGACLRYCVEQGCPIDKDVMEEYNKYKSRLSNY